MHILQSLAWRQQSDPQFLRPEILQDGDHSANVVGVAVGDGDSVETRDAACPQIGGDDVFAEVELRTAGTDGSAGIDEQACGLAG